MTFTIVFAFLKRFIGFCLEHWKPISIALAIVLVYRLHVHQVEKAVDQNNQAWTAKLEEAARKRDLENATKEATAKAEIESQVKVLHEKLTEAQEDAIAMHAKYDHSRVCLSDRSARKVPSAPTTASGSHDAAKVPGPSETVGTDIVELVTACKVETDKLVTLQEYAKTAQALCSAIPSF